MIKITQKWFSQYALCNPRQTSGMGAENLLKKVASVSAGVFTSILAASSKVYADAHGQSSSILHTAQEICEHAIWHKVGHVLHLGSFASGLLGGLLSFQTLGGKEEIYILQPLSKPTIIKVINPNTGKMDDCLVLPNGKRIIGQDILRFCSALHSVQIVASLTPGKRL